MSGLPGRKLGELIGARAMTALAADDIIPVYDKSIPGTRGIEVEDLFQGIPVDVELESATFPTLILKSTDTTVAAEQVIGAVDFETLDASSAGVGARVVGVAEAVTARIGLALYTGVGGSATEKVRIDYLGNVSIGIVNGDGTLHVHTATAGAVTAHVNADDLIVENSADGGITILTPNDATGALYFGDEDDSNVGRIIYQHGSVQMAILVEDTNVIDFLSTQIQARVPIKILEAALNVK